MDVRRWMRRAGAVAVALAGLTAPTALAWEIPLVVKNDARCGIPPFISGGAPLLPGQAKETSGLRLASRDRGGKLVAVPAQFRVLARYWRGDNSIRWVLVDFATANVPGERINYATVGTTVKGRKVWLTDAKLDVPATKSAVTVKDMGDEVVVSTGAAKFAVSK